MESPKTLIGIGSVSTPNVPGPRLI